jgi:hypothetical protein
MDKFLMGSKKQAPQVVPAKPADQEMKDDTAPAKPKFTPWIEK